MASSPSSAQPVYLEGAPQSPRGHANKTTLSAVGGVHLIHEETEAQKGDRTSPKSHRGCWLSHRKRQTPTQPSPQPLPWPLPLNL